MKRIFSILIALMLIFTAIPVIEAEASFMIPDDQFYIKFSAGSGEGGSVTEGPFSTESGTYLPSAEALGFSKEGYEFTGWNIGKAGSLYKTSGGKTVSAKAQWKEISSSGSSSSSSSSSSSTSSKSRYSVTYLRYRISFVGEGH